jgi:hypothetical protein
MVKGHEKLYNQANYALKLLEYFQKQCEKQANKTQRHVEFEVK